MRRPSKKVMECALLLLSSISCFVCQRDCGVALVRDCLSMKLLLQFNRKNIKCVIATHTRLEKPFAGALRTARLAAKRCKDPIHIPSCDCVLQFFSVSKATNSRVSPGQLPQERPIAREAQLLQESFRKRLQHLPQSSRANGLCLEKQHTFDDCNLQNMFFSFHFLLSDSLETTIWGRLMQRTCCVCCGWNQH